MKKAQHFCRIKLIIKYPINHVIFKPEFTITHLTGYYEATLIRICPLQRLGK